MRLIDNWRQAWRMFSVQAMALAGAIQTAWILMPPEQRASLPEHVAPWVSLALLVLGIIGRFVKQETVHE